MSVTRDKTQAELIITSLCNSAHLPYKFDFIRNGDVRTTDLGNRIVDDCVVKGGNCVREVKVDVCDVVDDKSSGDCELEEDRDVEGDGELEGRDAEEDRGKGVGRHVPAAGPPPSLRNLTSPI